MCDLSIPFFFFFIFSSLIGTIAVECRYSATIAVTFMTENYHVQLWKNIEAHKWLSSWIVVYTVPILILIKKKKFLNYCKAWEVGPWGIRFVIPPANEINSKIIEQLEVIRGVCDSIWFVPWVKEKNKQANIHMWRMLFTGKVHLWNNKKIKIFVVQYKALSLSFSF